MTTPTPDLKWIHHLERGAQNRTLLLLHGTGGDERSLLDLGRRLAPGANLLSVRGRSLEEGFPRFFRRFSAVQYDQPHLNAEADALADFVGAAAAHYGLDPVAVTALGYSNGANIALAALVRRPGTLAGAALLRPVMALEHPPQPDLSGVRVLALHGARDPFLPHAAALGPYLRGLGTDLTEQTLNAGHELSPQDLGLTAAWLNTGN